MKIVKTFLMIFSTLLILWIPVSQAQILSGKKTSATVGFYSQSWELRSGSKTVKINQLVFPLSFFVPLKDNYELKIFTSAALTDLDSTGGKNDLNGFNDTKIQVAGSFFDDQYLVSLGINLPSGKKSLEPEEMKVARFLSFDYLNLPVKNFGEGFNLNLNLVRVFEWKNLVWGVGAGYQYYGTYQPYHNFSDYKPGDRFHLTGVVSFNLGNVKLMGDLSSLQYQSDKQAGRKIFKDGNQFGIRGTLLYDKEPFSLAVQARFIIRAKDKRYEAALVYPEEINNELKNHGTDFKLASSFSYRVASKIKFIAEGEIKMIAENDFQPSDELYVGASHITGFGGGLNYDLKDNYYLTLLAKMFQGEADGGDLDLSGFQLQSSLFIRF